MVYNPSKKVFSKKDYNRSDPKSKSTCIKFIQQKFPHFKLTDNGFIDRHTYDVAFKDTINDRQIKIETEQKRVWTKSGVWEGYSTVDVPNRKVHNTSVYYVMFNIHFDTLAMAKTQDILNSGIIKKDTKGDGFETKNEPFFRVGLSLFEFYKKQGDNWIQI